MITQKYINQIAYNLVGCAIEVHKELGPGLLESVYERCLKYELIKLGYEVKSQVQVPVTYKGISMDCELRLDLIINNLIIVEIKSVEAMIPVYKAQLLTYLKLLGKPKGLLLNFNCGNITDELIPLVTPKFSSLPKE